MIWKQILKRLRSKSTDDVAQQAVAAEPTVARQNPARHALAVIGFDFGTAFTKVVIGVAGQKYGVPLHDGAQGSDKYLLPTPADLKLRIIQDDLDSATRERVIAHIAQVLCKSRDWLTTEKKSVLGGTLPKWEINIGLPTEKHTDEKLRDAYRALVAHAWHKSIDPNAKQTGDESNSTQNKSQREHIAAFPEFVAQIHGYLSSQQRQHGLHVLIDIGAGTIDATVFISHKKDERNVLPLMDASVKMLGTTFLATHRCNSLQKPGAYLPDPHGHFPTRQKFSAQLGVTSKDVALVDLEFQKQIIQCQIFPLLKRTKEEMAPKQAEWKSGIPLMLCGGGSRVEFYREVIDVLVTPKQGYPLRKIPLYLPDRLEAPGLSEEDLDRLSVAHGLSFNKLNIDEVTHPLPFSDDEKSSRQWETCHRCHGTGGLHRLCDECEGKGYVRKLL